MQLGMADEKERRLQDARAASVYAMPPRDFYEGVGDDLIAGLQVRYTWMMLDRMCLTACVLLFPLTSSSSSLVTFG